MTRRQLDYYALFAVLVIGIFVVVHQLTGYEVLGAAARLLWNLLALLVNTVTRFFGEIASVLGRAIGMRRLSRLATAMGSVGLSYAGAVILSDKDVRRAQGWRHKLRAALTVAATWWKRLHIAWKLAIVAVLIASQVYLHFALIIFPVAFLVPVMRSIWIQVGDTLVAGWYRHRFGRAHRRVVKTMQALPPYRAVSRALRLLRLRYLCAWRIWKYDPRYRFEGARLHSVSLIEPIRLWRRGELDRYLSRPLLGGGRKDAASQCCVEGAPTSDPPTTV
jgi:hypothetical protein